MDKDKDTDTDKDKDTDTDKDKPIIKRVAHGYVMWMRGRGSDHEG